MARTLAFYQQIVESMNEGVMALDTKGRIILFNHAAGRILGLEPETVLEKPFGQVFMLDQEENDEFCQAILDAIYKSAVGLVTTVEFTRKDKETRVVTMATSYLKSIKGTDSEREGIVIVINDITRITRSQEKEKKLNHELTEAFLRMEETKRQLETALKKVKWTRFFVVLFLAVGLAGTGCYLWLQGNLSSTLTFSGRDRVVPEPGTDRETGQVAVMVQPLHSSISLSGTIAPLEEISITAPFDGKIKEQSFVYDQKVEKGEPLMTMDTSQLEVELRNAKAAYIKAVQKYKEVENWTQSPEVSDARRSLTKTKNRLENLKRKLEESKILHGKGIISGTELDSAKEEYINQQMDLAASEESMASILEKGNQENLDIARMEMANARVVLEEIEDKLTHAVIPAPVSGVIIKPQLADGLGQGQSKSIAPGRSVTQGDVLVAVANLDGLSVKAKVDEIDIGKIRVNQKVLVAGDAFAGTPLTGYVRRIASNAESDGMEGPMFGVTVAIEKLTPEVREKIRLGMSTNLEIVVYDNPEALLIPLDTVEVREDRKFVQIIDDTGALVEKEVVTGLTTMDSVEILSGLESSDIVHYSGAPPPAPPALRPDPEYPEPDDSSSAVFSEP